MSFRQYKKITIHCGVHKTGSSYLQEVLRSNASVLARHGIFYPTGPNREIERTGNHSLVASTYQDSSDVTEHFQRHLLLEPASWLLLSGEEFARLDRPENFLDKLVFAAEGADLQFIFYFRRHDHLRESVYAESVKHSLYGDISRTKFNFNFFETVRPFVDAVGARDVTVRAYNRDTWPDGELINDFFGALGRPQILDELVLPEMALINSSLSRPHTFLLSRLATEKAKLRLLAFFREQPLPVSHDTSKYFMSPHERREFRMLHASSTSAMAELFGISDVDGFLGTNETPNELEWSPYVPDWPLLTDYMAEFADWNEII